MKNKGRGFTLVELLAVIVILAIILVIAVPKIADTIKNSKIASFESSAKTIAAQAEKKKMEKEILEDSDSINCSDVVKLNDTDYGNCSITFDGNTAKVTLVGKGKFEGLKITNGTKDSATAGEIKPPEYGKAVDFINELYDYNALLNGLKKDNTSDANIRYEGGNPNNYVLFNDELWRIIGVFGDNIKLVRSEELGELSWDSSDSSINGGYGVNEWSQADLKEYLNTKYYGGTSVTCYGGSNNKTTTCPTGSLNETAKSMIDYHTWDIGAIDGKDTTIRNQETYAINLVPLYNAERGSTNGKICISGSSCNDTIERTTTWQGYVALPYLTDWAYANSDNLCLTAISNKYNGNEINMTCMENNWMYFHGNTNMDGILKWVLSPYVDTDIASSVFSIMDYGDMPYVEASSSLPFFPSVYLNSDVKITSGSGTSSDPYILGV